MKTFKVKLMIQVNYIFSIFLSINFVKEKYDFKTCRLFLHDRMKR